MNRKSSRLQRKEMNGKPTKRIQKIERHDNEWVRRKSEYVSVVLLQDRGRPETTEFCVSGQTEKQISGSEYRPDVL